MWAHSKEFCCDKVRPRCQIRMFAHNPQSHLRCGAFNGEIYAFQANDPFVNWSKPPNLCKIDVHVQKTPKNTPLIHDLSNDTFTPRELWMTDDWMSFVVAKENYRPMVILLCFSQVLVRFIENRRKLDR
jgi:hypothetical protein